MLVSTVDNRIKNLNLYDEYYYTISHQITEYLEVETIRFIEELKKQKNIRYVPCKRTGVAANRNNAIKYRFKDCVYVISDDDVEYDRKLNNEIIKSVRKFGAITFQICRNSNTLFKSYSKNTYNHSLLTIGSVGSVEIAFNDAFLRDMTLFNERFGPGARFSIGEDFIFMFDNVVRKRRKIQYCTIPFVYHPDVSTGKKFSYDINVGRGAMFRYCFGYIGLLVNLLFAVKKWTVYRSQISFVVIIREMYVGWKRAKN